MFRQVSLATLVRPLLFLAVLFVAMVLYLSGKMNMSIGRFLFVLIRTQSLNS